MSNLGLTFQCDVNLVWGVDLIVSQDLWDAFHKVTIPGSKPNGQGITLDGITMRPSRHLGPGTVIGCSPRGKDLVDRMNAEETT